MEQSNQELWNNYERRNTSITVIPEEEREKEAE